MAKKIKYTWETVPLNDIPKSINAYLNKHFSSDVVFGIVKNEENKSTFYVIDVDHNGLYHHIKFDHAGTFVSDKVEVTSESDGEHFNSIGTGD